MSNTDDLFSDKSNQQILESLLPALAKCSSELRTARADLTKALDRTSFSIALVNELLYRADDEEVK